MLLETFEAGGEEMEKAGIAFFVAWMLCGCSVETMLDDPIVGVIALISMIIAVACAIRMSRKG